MRARLNHWREVLRSSLWFVPSLMSLAAGGLALVLLRVDTSAPAAFLPEGLSFRAGPEGARALLTTLAGAMIGVTGVTFSITVVALTLASQQFGPRLLRNFLRDRANQFVLGTFMGTFLYTLLVLQSIEADAGASALPRLAITVAILLGMASLAVLIFFIHHAAHGIQADAIIASVARELDANIDRLYPAAADEGLSAHPATRLPTSFDEDSIILRAERSGYLQAVDEDLLLALSVEHDVVLRLLHRPGDFVMEGSPLARAWPSERVPAGFELRIREHLILGRDRTPEQDTEFAIDQLVEVAVRALSPGVNDPFTAMRCVDRLGAALCRVAKRRFPSPYREDASGTLRIVARRADFAGLVDASFNQIRQYGRGSAAVTIRLLEVVAVVAGCIAGRAELREPLLRQARRIREGAQDAGHASSDLADIEARYREALAALDEQPAEAAPRTPDKRQHDAGT